MVFCDVYRARKVRLSYHHTMHLLAWQTKTERWFGVFNTRNMSGLLRTQSDGPPPLDFPETDDEDEPVGQIDWVRG